MHTVQEIKEMVAEYRKEYPEMKSQVSIESLEAMAAAHGQQAIDDCYDVVVKQFEAEIDVIELVKVGVPFEDAVKQVYTPQDDTAQV
jgi:vacuolar-type H+-ATPase subunit D/Vma8